MKNNSKRFLQIKSMMKKADDESASYMAKPQLYNIMSMSKELHDKIRDGEQLPDWAESHIAKCEEMIQSVYNKLTYEKRNSGKLP